MYVLYIILNIFLKASVKRKVLVVPIEDLTKGGGTLTIAPVVMPTEKVTTLEPTHYTVPNANTVYVYA